MNSIFCKLKKFKTACDTTKIISVITHFSDWNKFQRKTRKSSSGSTIYIECKSVPHLPFRWDCFWKVHGLKFHPIWFSSISMQYRLLWKTWKNNCFLCWFVFQHIFNVFCGEKKSTGTLLFRGPLSAFFLLIVKVSERTFDYQGKVIHFSPFLKRCCF